MTYDEKYDWMMRCGDETDFGMLKDADEQKLLVFLDDEDEIIRATAVDILGRSNRDAVMEKLAALAKNDPSYIVRAYCCASILDIAEETHATDRIIPFLKKAYAKERSMFVRLAWLSDLSRYLSPDDSPAPEAIIRKGLISRNRHLRNLAVNALLADERLRALFSDDYLFEAYERETCRYIRVKMEKLK